MLGYERRGPHAVIRASPRCGGDGDPSFDDGLAAGTARDGPHVADPRRLTARVPPARMAPDSLSEVAYVRIREQIRHGGFPPGSRIRERDVCERVSIGRTPVREALRRLEAERLLAVAPGGGLAIASLDAQTTAELYAMREILEGSAAALAARHASDAEVSVIRDLIDRAPSLAGDPDALARLNREIHHAIFLGAHNRYLLRSIATLTDALMLLTTTTFRVDGRPATAHAEHLAMIEAIERRDVAAAEAAARVHIRAAHRSRLILQQHAARPVQD